MAALVSADRRRRRLAVWAWLGSLAVTGCGAGKSGSAGAADTAAPTIVSVSPAEVTGVPVNAIIGATFSEKVDPSSITDASVGITGVAATLRAKCSSVFLEPVSDLSFDTSYTLTIKGVRDAAGNVL